MYAKYYIYSFHLMKTFQELKRKLLRKNILLAISGIVIGTAGGFMYFYFIGCRTGSCPITSSPWLSMLWGATVGFLIFDMFRKKKEAVTQQEDKQQ